MQIFFCSSTTTGSLFILLVSVGIMGILLPEYLNNSLVDCYCVLDQLKPMETFDFKGSEFHLMSVKAHQWSYSMVLDLY